MVIGIYASIDGALGILGGALVASLGTMVIGQAVAGVGFGASFAAALRLILPLAATPQRAGLAAAICLVSYVAFGVPVVVAGRLIASLGVAPTVLWYSAASALSALVALGAQFRLARPDHARSGQTFPPNIRDQISGSGPWQCLIAGEFDIPAT
jgi:hypothetical protein